MAAKKRGITVVGSGSVHLPSDRVELNVGVETLRSEAAAAFETTAASVTSVLSALRSGGVEDRLIRTVDLRLGPRTSYQNNAEVLLGYTCGQRLVATVVDITALPDLLAAVAGSGVEGVRLEGISFSAGDPAAALAEARAAAVADAKEKAADYARLVGVDLGPVTTVRELPADGGPTPLPKVQRMAVAAASMPVSAGETELVVTVEVHFGLG